MSTRWKTDDEDQEGSAESEYEDDQSEEDEEQNPDGGDEDLVEDVPPELEEAYQEATAFLTRAKKQRAEVEKARGFFKRGARKEGRDAAVHPLKSKLPCSKCGQLGHWHKDKECPKYNEPFKNRPGGKRKPHGAHVTFNNVWATSVTGAELGLC